MKRRIFLLFAMVIAASAGFSQAPPYKVVFDLTSKDTSMHQRVIRWLNGIVGSHENATLEVVFYGGSLGMVTKEKSVVADQVVQLAKTGKVKFVVCEAAMKFHNISASQLLPGVLTVPDGIYEILIRQGEGYGYIKATM
jgi:hypothetical protein